MRISINSTITSLYTKQHVSSEHWDVRRKRVLPGEEQSAEINKELDRLKNLVLYHHGRIVSEGGVVTANIVKQLLSREAGADTLLSVFREHNAAYKKRAGKDRSILSWKSYEVIYACLGRFIKQHYHTEDITLKSLNIDFINNYEFYLRVVRRLSPNTVRCRVALVWQIARLAVSKGLLPCDPFLGYVPERVKPNTDFLAGDEFDKILSLDLQNPKLCLARDLFVFSAFTGLAYCDIETLESRHICLSSDGEKWIIKKRQNSQMESKIILLDIPLGIIRKYQSRQIDEKIFHAPHRTEISRSLRSISHACGFGRTIVFKMARPCFAGLITLKHGLSVETVSRMMGYASAEAARRFINIDKQKVANDMEELNRKMEGLYRLQNISVDDMENTKEVFIESAKWSKTARSERVLLR